MSAVSTYSVAVMRSDGVAGIERRNVLTELCERMTSCLGAIFIPHLANSYRSIADGVERGNVGVTWMSPLLTMECVDRNSGQVVAVSMRRGSTASFYSAIIVKHGTARTLSELVNKRAIWVDRESVAGRIAARIHLASHGFDLRSLASETFAGSHEGVVDALLSGRADVGATFCTLDPRANRIAHGAWTNLDGSNSKPIDVLATAGPIPNDGILASTKMPVELREKLSRFLINAEDKRSKDLLAKLVRAESFSKCPSTHFAPLRTMLDTAKRLGVDL